MHSFTSIQTHSIKYQTRRFAHMHRPTQNDFVSHKRPTALISRLCRVGPPATLHLSHDILTHSHCFPFPSYLGITSHHYFSPPQLLQTGNHLICSFRDKRRLHNASAFMFISLKAFYYFTVPTYH